MIASLVFLPCYPRLHKGIVEMSRRATATLWGLSSVESIFIGAALVATSVGITAQVLAAAKSDRAFYRVQNQSSGDLWINDKGATAAASQPAFKLAVGAMYVSEPGGAPSAAISIFGATTGQAFEAAEG